MTKDVLASIVVFLVALPLCMGIAIASGAPPAAGLITGIIGGIIVGALSGAPFQVSGPAAGLAVIIFQLVNQHGIEAIGPLVLMAGAMQFAGGLLRFGTWFRAIAPPVVFGMLAGIGVLIFAGQFHVMVDDKPRANGLLNIASLPESVVKGLLPIDQHSWAAMIGLITIAVILLWNSFRPEKLKFIPGLLLGAVTASIVANVANLPIHFVNVPADLVGSLAIASVDTIWKFSLDPKMIAEAFGLAMVASAETMLCVVAVDRMHTGPRAKFDRELAAQGFGNMLCGFFGGLPMTGVVVRSAANINAGAQTRLSAILHGVWILGFALLLPGVLSLIPASSLAAILVYTGIKLINIDNIRELLKYGKMPVVIYGITITGIVVFDLLTGVLIGVGISILKLLYQVTHLGVRIHRYTGSDRVDMHLSGSATFIGLPKLAIALETIPVSANLHVHFTHLHHIDHACLDALSNWQTQNAAAGARLVVEWDELLTRYGRPRSASPGESDTTSKSAPEPPLEVAA